MQVYLIWSFATALNIKAMQKGRVFYALTVLKESMPKGLKSWELQPAFIGNVLLYFYLWNSFVLVEMHHLYLHCIIFIL